MCERVTRYPGRWPRSPHSGSAAIRVVAAVAGLAIRRTYRREALREAKQLTRVTALSAVEPDLTDRCMTGGPPRWRDWIAAVRTRVLRSPVVRVKLWTLDGRIVYSDAAR